MNKGIFVKEFYIGRYIYLVNELRNLSAVNFVRMGKYQGVYPQRDSNEISV